MIKGNCNICHEPVAPGKDKAHFNRNLGLHKWKKHGIPSANAQSQKIYRARAKAKAEAKAKGIDISQIQLPPTPRNGSYRRRSLLPQLATPATVVEVDGPRRYESAPLTTSPAIPAKLCECPNCGTRFYMVKGQPA